MNILIISQYYEPDITAAAFRISETVSHLRKKGHEVRVITTYPHKSAGGKKENFIADDQYVYRCRLPETGGKGFAGYVIHYLAFMFKSIGMGLKPLSDGWKPDVIWASSPPMFTGISGYVLSKKFRCPWVMDVRDIWPGSAVATGQLLDSGIAYGIASLLESFLYKKADAVSCVAEPMSEYIRQHTSRPVIVIYNGVDADSLQKVKAFTEADPERSVKTIMYAGNLGHVQQLDLLIEAFDEARTKGLSSSWQLVFLGDGVQKENLVKLSYKLKLNGSVKFHPPVSKEEAMSQMASSDLLYLSLMPDEVLRMTIPSKVYDYMILSRPVIAGIFGEGREILQESGMNYIFDPGNKEMLIDLLLTIDKKYRRNEKLTSNKKLVEQKFSRENQADRLEKVFLGLL